LTEGSTVPHPRVRATAAAARWARAYLIVVLLFVTAWSTWGVAESAFTATTSNSGSSLTTAADFSAGELDTWGGGHGYVLSQMSTVTTWTSVSSANLSACGIRSDTTLWCWGEGRSGLGDTIARTEPTQVVSPAATGWTAVSVGGVHTCAIRTGGTLWCWGTNDDGQLGNGNTTTQLSPAQVTTPSTGWTAVAAGDYYTCALRTAALWCFGRNDNGQLGIGGTAEPAAPAQVTSPSLSWASVRPGQNHTCGVTTGGALYCWGGGDSGMLGQGNTTEYLIPTQVTSPSATGWSNLTSGYDFTCAMRTSSLYCWGRNTEGQLGVGDTTDRLVPTQVTGTWTGAVAGIRHVCGIKAGPTVWCSGQNPEGQLGTGDTTTLSTPTQVAVSGMSTLWGGPITHQMYVIKTDGTLWGWGRYFHRTMVPAQVGAVTTWDGRGLAAGLAHACGLRSDTSLWCWGQNTDGRVGIGATSTYEAAPVQISSPGTTGWTMVAGGDSHTCGVRTSRVYCWGSNSSGQLGNGNTTDQATPTLALGGYTNWSTVDAGLAHSCGLRATGALYCWGANSNGQLGIGSVVDTSTPTVVSGTWSSISVGSTHTCGIKTAGTLWCWGNGADGRLGLGSATQFTSPQQVGVLTTWTSVAAGGAANCGILAAGSLWCWGKNTDGQVGQGNTSAYASPTQVGSATTWRSVTGGLSNFCATQSGRTVLCWGEGRLGANGDDDSLGAKTSPTAITGYRARPVTGGANSKMMFAIP
jgi:alpha-tubulin suppressor-like RCC1 family protein